MPALRSSTKKNEKKVAEPKKVAKAKKEKVEKKPTPKAAKKSKKGEEDDNMPTTSIEIIPKPVDVRPPFPEDSIFSDDEVGEEISKNIRAMPEYKEPENWSKLRTLWHALVKGLSVKVVESYYEVLHKMLRGRISSLQPIDSLVEGFPNDMIHVHSHFFNLISSESSVYPYSYHTGTKLISKHFIGGVKEIGAAGMLISLFHGVLPWQENEASLAITRISSIVRTEIKDILEIASAKTVEAGETVIKMSDIKIPKVNL